MWQNESWVTDGETWSRRHPPQPPLTISSDLAFKQNFCSLCEKETFSCILIQNSHMPFGSYDRVPSPTPVSAPLGFSNYPSAVSLRSWAGGEHLQINKQNSTPQIHRCMIHQPQHLVFKVKFKMTPGQN